jgi:hypothetical protein
MGDPGSTGQCCSGSRSARFLGLYLCFSRERPRSTAGAVPYSEHYTGAISNAGPDDAGDRGPYHGGATHRYGASGAD